MKIRPATKILGTLSLVVLMAACDEGSTGGGGTGGGGALEFDLDFDMSSVPQVTPPVRATTPQSLGGLSRAGISNTSTGLIVATIPIPTDDSFCTPPNNPYDTLCGGFTVPDDNGSNQQEVDDAKAAQNLCKFIADVKCGLFVEGPTEIEGLARKVDGRVADLDQRAGDNLIPCLDPESEGYNAVDFDTNFTDLAADRAGNAQSIDLGVNYKLSCAETTSTPGQTAGSEEQSFVGFGQETVGGVLKTYVREGNTAGGGSLAILDQDANVDFYFTMGVDKNATTSAEINQSAGLIHLNVNGISGVMQLTFTGKGLGPGCGAVFMTDGKLLYAKANINHDTKCSQAEQDDGLGNPQAPDFEEGKAAVEYCLQVDVPTSITSLDMQQCADAGLSESDLTITPLSRSDLAPYNGARLFSDALDGVPALTFEERPTPPDDDTGTGTGTDTSDAPSALSFTCSVYYQDGTIRNCSAGTINATTTASGNICGLPETGNANETFGLGQGCCDQARVYTNAFGPATQFEVVPAGNLAGEGVGTIFACPHTPGANQITSAN